jgi:hypothetical protein
MKDSPPEPAFQSQCPGVDSRDCVNFVVDGIGDSTVRPLRPQLLQFALAERERLARWQEQIEEQRPRVQSEAMTDPKNGTP